MRIRIDIAYRGTGYHGWQRQDGVQTVQGMIEAALLKLVGDPVLTRGSSRTDAGVHALGQVAVFDTTSSIPPERFADAINANLPRDIRILCSKEVPTDFDPVVCCTRKRYRYLIDDSRILSPFLLDTVWHYRFGQLDAGAMHTAAQTLVGEHDFASFQSQGSLRQSTVRTIFDVSVEHRVLPLPVIVIEVEGSGFLYHMVRNISGTLVAVGSGRKPIPWIAEVIAAKNREAAGVTAPPEGLYLLKISF